jgi:hypothetical protein
MLKSSVYGTKLDTAGLFLRQIADRGVALQALLTPHLGNGFVDKDGQLIRFAALAQSAPKLDPAKIDQIAALPLGGRVKMGVWNDEVAMVKTPPTAISSARDKMPLEVTPFFPRLTRITMSGSSENTTSATNQATPANN